MAKKDSDIDWDLLKARINQVMTWLFWGFNALMPFVLLYLMTQVSRFNLGGGLTVYLGVFGSLLPFWSSGVIILGGMIYFSRPDPEKPKAKGK